MENFFSTLKTELVYRQTWRTRDEAENALFAYIWAVRAAPESVSPDDATISVRTAFG
jgi:hypothetical protein